MPHLLTHSLAPLAAHLKSSLLQRCENTGERWVNPCDSHLIGEANELPRSLFPAQVAYLADDIIRLGYISGP